MQIKRLNKIFFSALILICSISTQRAESAQRLNLVSSAFSNDGVMPKKYTGDGANASPPLAWSVGPKGTKSFALCCLDPDAGAEAFCHWILFNVSPNTQQLGENVPKVVSLAQGVTQGVNDSRTPGYKGPAPPDKKTHHYSFQIMALDTALPLKPGCDKNFFTAAIKGHILAEGKLTGTYKR